MRKNLKAFRRFAAPLALCAIFLFGCAAVSDAHMYFSFPSNSGKTGQIDVYTTFALNPPTPDESGYGTIKYDIVGRIVDPLGVATAVTDFPFADSATGKAYTDAELQAMTPEQAEAAVDSRKSTVTVSAGGTSVFITETNYENNETYEGVVYHQAFVCSSKAFLNLTSDDASTKPYLTAGLELVPVEDLAEAAPASAVKVKALLGGAPLAGLGIYVSHEGCPPNSELHGEVAAMRVASTGADGVATLTLPSRPGNTYFFAMYLDPAQTTETNFAGAMASLSFATSVDLMETEIDASDFLFAANGNEAGLDTPIMTEATVVDLLRTSFGAAWANDLVSTPSGTSSFVTDQAGQLPGDETGVTFEIPMDIPGTTLKGVIGTEQLLELTSEIVGKRTFDDMVAFLKKAQTDTPDRFLSGGGFNFYCPYTAKDFLGEFGIAVMGRFSDDTVADIGDNFMLGVLYDEANFDAGSIVITYGTLYIDDAPADGSYAQDLTPIMNPENFAKVPLLHDGAADDKIAMTYWLARTGSDGGSSGCNAGIPLGVLLAATLCAAFKGKKRD